jgi:hypothetical protein
LYGEDGIAHPALKPAGPEGQRRPRNANSSRSKDLPSHEPQ